jgi:hypothetical protein
VARQGRRFGQGLPPAIPVSTTSSLVTERSPGSAMPPGHRASPDHRAVLLGRQFPSPSHGMTAFFARRRAAPLPWPTSRRQAPPAPGILLERHLVGVFPPMTSSSCWRIWSNSVLRCIRVDSVSRTRAATTGAYRWSAVSADRPFLPTKPS